MEEWCGFSLKLFPQTWICHTAFQFLKGWEQREEAVCARSKRDNASFTCTRYNWEPPWLTQQKGFVCIADRENTKRWAWDHPDGPQCSISCHIPSLKWVYLRVLMGSHVSLTVFWPCWSHALSQQWFPARKHHSSGLEHTPYIIADSLTWQKHRKHFYCLRTRGATPELGEATCSLGRCGQERDSPEHCGHWSIPLGLRVRDTH